MKRMQLGLLIGCGGVQQAIPHEIFDVAVVVEETIMLHNFKDVAQSFAMLMGIIYCVNLKYPDTMKYTFEFLQRVLMNIKPDQAKPTPEVQNVMFFFLCFSFPSEKSLYKNFVVCYFQYTKMYGIVLK